MNTYIGDEEQVPCIRLLDYRVTKSLDNTYVLKTVWEDQCHHQYKQLFNNDTNDDTQGVWLEIIHSLPSLQHAAAEVKIQIADHARQGGYTSADKPKCDIESEETTDAPSQLKLFIYGVIFAVSLPLIFLLTTGKI